jgi:isopentenyldiphosphate isomerase
MDKRILNIIDDSGKIIGIDSRENIHAKGFRHMEVHVWFITTKREIIFQHRSKTKDTYPDFLDATVGGHVEIGSDYLKTAIKETEEETGLKINKKDIKLIKIIKTGARDHITGKINNVLRAIYRHVFTGKIEDLKSEEEKGVGFEPIGLEELRDLGAEKRKKIIPNVITDVYMKMFKEMVRKI